MTRSQSLLVFDAALLVAVCVLEAVSLTGLSVHEWLAIVLGGLLLVHVLLQWSWIASRTRRVLVPRARRTRVNYLLNLGLFVAMVVTIASGVMISEVVAPALGAPNAGGVWRDIHGFATNAVVLFVGLHVGLNLDWVLPAVRQWFA